MKTTLQLIMYIILACTIIVTSSCNGNPEDEAFSVELDGNAFKVSKVTTEFPNSLDENRIVIKATTSGLLVDEIEILIGDLTKSEFVLEEFGLGDASVSYSPNDLFDTYSSVSGELIITEYSAADKTLKGTFNGVLQGFGGDDIEMTNGAFDVTF